MKSVLFVLGCGFVALYAAAGTAGVLAALILSGRIERREAE